MKKIIAIDFDEFLVPGNTKVEFAGMIFENAVNGWDIAKMGKLIYKCLHTEYHLKEFNKYIKKGDTFNAENSARAAYCRYDGIINGVPESLLHDFSKEYASSFSEDGADVLDELKSEGWELHIVSGAIKPCVETILEENGVRNHFKGIYCNTLDTQDGIIQRLKKEVITPYGKILKLTKENPSLMMSEDVTAVGYDLWDYELLKKANMAIVLDSVKCAAEHHIKGMMYERRKNNRKSRIINNLYELPKTLEQMEHLKSR